MPMISVALIATCVRYLDLDIENFRRGFELRAVSFRRRFTVGGGPLPTAVPFLRINPPLSVTPLESLFCNPLR